MATKYITRTVQQYTYTTGKLNLSTMQISGLKSHVYGYKLGAREEKKLEKADGAPIIARDVEEMLYGISMEDFLLWGVPMGPDGKPCGKSRGYLKYLDSIKHTDLDELSE